MHNMVYKKGPTYSQLESKKCNHFHSLLTVYFIARSKGSRKTDNSKSTQRTTSEGRPTIYQQILNESGGNESSRERVLYQQQQIDPMNRTQDVRNLG